MYCYSLHTCSKNLGNYESLHSNSGREKNVYLSSKTQIFCSSCSNVGRRDDIACNFSRLARLLILQNSSIWSLISICVTYKLQFILRREHTLSITKAVHWMLLKIVINFYSEKHRMSINTLFEIILMLNQVVRILATIPKTSDVKNTSHGSHSTLLLLQRYPRTNVRNSKYKAWNSTKNVLFTLTQNNVSQHYAALFKIYRTSETSIMT